MSYTFQYRNWDYSFNEIYVNSPQVHIDVQELLNSIRAQEASEKGITYPQIAVASGKDPLSGTVETGITLRLLNDWEVEWYVGDYVATVDGGNLVAESGNVFHPVIGGPQIEILRSAAATIVSTGGSALTTDEHNRLMGIPTDPLLFSQYTAPDNAFLRVLLSMILSK